VVVVCLTVVVTERLLEEEMEEEEEEEMEALRAAVVVVAPRLDDEDNATVIIMADEEEDDDEEREEGGPVDDAPSARGPDVVELDEAGGASVDVAALVERAVADARLSARVALELRAVLARVDCIEGELRTRAVELGWLAKRVDELFTTIATRDEEEVS